MEPSDGTRSEADRIRAALLELLSEQAYSSTTVEQVAHRAGVDPAAIERLFGGLGGCFGTIWDEVDAELSGRMATAFENEGDWRSGLREALRVALRYLAVDPGRALLYMSESPPDDRLRARRQAAGSRLGAMVDLGRAARPGAVPAPPRISEAIAGAIWHRVTQLLRTGRAAELPAELPMFMYFAVLPYYGKAVAERELRRAGD